MSARLGAALLVGFGCLLTLLGLGALAFDIRRLRRADRGFRTRPQTIRATTVHTEGSVEPVVIRASEPPALTTEQRLDALEAEQARLGSEFDAISKDLRAQAREEAQDAAQRVEANTRDYQEALGRLLGELLGTRTQKIGLALLVAGLLASTAGGVWALYV